MDVKLLSGALGAEISGIDLKDTSIKNLVWLTKVLMKNNNPKGILLILIGMFIFLIYLKKTIYQS